MTCRPIKVAIFAESCDGFNGFVAKCIDFNLAAQGETVREAQLSFERVLKTHLIICDEREIDPFSGAKLTPSSPEREVSPSGSCKRSSHMPSVSYNRLTEIAA